MPFSQGFLSIFEREVYNSTPFEIIVVSVAIGIIIAGFVILYQNKVVGSAVRTILKKGANSPETALSIENLGIKKKSLKAYNLRTNTYLRKLVKKTEDNRFFIPEELRIRAELRYDKKKASVFSVITTVIFVVIVGYLLIEYYPMLSDMMNEAIENFKNTVS